MKVKIFPSTPRGEVKAPGSKSVAHRLLLAAALADGVSVIRGIPECEDFAMTLGCVKALGVRCEVSEDTVTVYGTGGSLTPTKDLTAKESGSTLRFIIPILLTLGEKVTIRGAERLFERPLSVYEEIAKENGFLFDRDKTSLTVCGKLKPGIFNVPGNISSQFISGLMFALPTLDGDSEIRISTPTESASYINLTVDALRKFGVTVRCDGNSIFIRGNQTYTPADLSVEGDYSGSVFIDALTLLGGDTRAIGLNPESAQGDAVYLEHLKKLKDGHAEIDLTDCPDLAPVLFAIAAELNGAEFTGTARLRMKESDRALAMKEELARLGGILHVKENSVTVEKRPLHAPSAPIKSHNDHRIVMAMATLLTKYGGEIEGAEAVRKSYPCYFSDLSSVGVTLEYED